MALAWPNHVHHARALQWFQQVREDGWATCPLTESGFVRVSCNARIIPGARPPAEVIALLREIRRQPGHTFWPDDVSPTDADPGVFARAVGYRQITDAHLVTLAHRQGGRLATLDRGVLELVGDERAHLVEVIGKGH